MDEVCSRYQQQIAELTFLPSSGGKFEVTLNGELLFSKKALGRHAEPGEIVQLLVEKCGWEPK